MRRNEPRKSRVTSRSSVWSEQWTLQPSYAWIKDQFRVLKRSINFNVVEYEVFIDILSYSTKKLDTGQREEGGFILWSPTLEM